MEAWGGFLYELQLIAPNICLDLPRPVGYARATWEARGHPGVVMMKVTEPKLAKTKLTEPNVTELLEEAKRDIDDGEVRLRAAAAEKIAEARRQGASQRQIAHGVGKSTAWVNRLLKWHDGGYQEDTPFGPRSKASRQRLRVQATERDKKKPAATTSEQTEAAAAQARAQKAKADASVKRSKEPGGRDRQHDDGGRQDQHEHGGHRDRQHDDGGRQDQHEHREQPRPIPPEPTMAETCFVERWPLARAREIANASGPVDDDEAEEGLISCQFDDHSTVLYCKDTGDIFGIQLVYDVQDGKLVAP